MFNRPHPSARTMYPAVVLLAVLGIVLLLQLQTVSYSASLPQPSAADASATNVTPIPVPTASNAWLPITLDAPKLKAAVGYQVREPSFLPEGYQLQATSVDEPTRSVCLQYRYRHATVNHILLIAQGPVELTPPLTHVPEWPEGLVLREPISIGGAGNSFRLAGWQRNGWACSEAAAAEPAQFSPAVVPQLTWEAGGQQFDLVVATAGCRVPGGLTPLDVLRIAEGLTGTSTHASDDLDPDCMRSIAEVEKLAGFDVKEPTYLPEGVSFDFATYRTTPRQNVTLHFKIVHKEYGDMGAFLQIAQDAAAQAPPQALSCQDAIGECQLLDVGVLSAVYRRSGHSETFDWYSDGLAFSLVRTAGEPGKVYKDELVKVIRGLRF